MRDLEITGFIAVWVLVFILLCSMAQSQEQFEHTHEGEVGKFYQTWMQPDTNRMTSCCGLGDCYPTEVKNVGGTWFYLQRETLEWKVIPASKLEENYRDAKDSPDGRNHVCASKYGAVFCAVRGSGA